MITFSCKRVRHSKVGARHKRVVELVCLRILLIIILTLMIITIIIINFMMMTSKVMKVMNMMMMKMILPPLHQTQDEAACICPAN